MFGAFILLFFLSLILLVVGLIKPDIIPNNKSRKKVPLIFGLAAIVFFIAMLITAPPSSPKKTNNSTQNSKITPSPTASSPTPEPTISNKQTVKVIRVIDGDTIEIEGGQKVRYIGIDTPETVDPRKSIQCFGKEASDKNKELVDGKEVELEKDVSETDKYGRLLRYIWLGDKLINEVLVREGYAQSSSYPPDIKYQERFNEAEKKAREENKGLWGEMCEITPIPTRKIILTPTPTKTTVPKTSTPTPLSQTQNLQIVPIIPQTSGSYVCDCSKTCTQISSCEEAQYQLNICHCSARDGDKDGIACDGAPLNCQQ